MRCLSSSQNDFFLFQKTYFVFFWRKKRNKKTENAHIHVYDYQLIKYRMPFLHFPQVANLFGIVWTKEHAWLTEMCFIILSFGSFRLFFVLGMSLKCDLAVVWKFSRIFGPTSCHRFYLIDWKIALN